MKITITTAWASEEGENPWLVSAYDEWTMEAWNGTPDFFDAEIAKLSPSAEVRIIELVVDADAIEERFSASTLQAGVSS